MMLGLLICSHSTGTFASRRIATLTHENVAHHLLELAAHARVLKVGAITVANASKISP